MRELLLIFTLFAVLLLVLLPAVGRHIRNTNGAAELQHEDMTNVFDMETADTLCESTPSDTIYPMKQPLYGEEQVLEVVCRDGVHTLTLEAYLRGILMAELPYSFSDEAWKALAVAARSYVLYRLEHGLPLSDDSTVCTAYLSDKEAMERFGEQYPALRRKSEMAVRATARQVLMYDGEICCAVFHAMSYGRTEDAAVVWGSEIAYLSSVTTPEEKSLDGLCTSVTMDARVFLSSLSLDEISLYTTEKTESGRVECMTFCSSTDSVTLSGTELRRIFSLRSANFAFSKNEDGSVVFLVYGYGHGVGMSQWGAHLMAEAGYDYLQILLHYYQNAECVTI